MQFDVHNVAKLELDSTSATVEHKVTRKNAPCVRDLKLTCYCVDHAFIGNVTLATTHLRPLNIT